LKIVLEMRFQFKCCPIAGRNDKQTSFSQHSSYIDDVGRSVAKWKINPSPTKTPIQLNFSSSMKSKLNFLINYRQK